MSFNPSKCYILTTSQNRWINTFLYYLCGCVVRKVPTSKYLGVTLNEDLQWNAHIKTICASASRTLGFLRRNLKRCPTELQELAYRALVRSKLEYACSVWDPYLTKDKNLLENIQERSTLCPTRSQTKQQCHQHAKQSRVGPARRLSDRSKH